jgi:predicted transposase/invertase (TIGR01784 family)
LYSRIELLENNIIELEKMRVQSEHEPDLFQKKTNEWSLRYGILESIQIVIEILSSENSPSFQDAKNSFLDLKAKDKEGFIYQIELQVAEQASYTKRSLYYASTLIHNQLKAGESYFKISPVIQINILDFPVFPNQNIVNWFLLKEKTNPTLVLTEDLQMIYVELPKFHKDSIEELESGMDIWLFLLKNSQTLTEEDTLKLKQKLPDLQNAFGVLELYATDPEKQRQLEERLRSDENFAYEMAAKYELGLARGLEQGIEKGIEQGIGQGEYRNKLETARKMLGKRFSPSEIQEITGLSPDDLKKNGLV